jgi:hypothetical protein
MDSDSRQYDGSQLTLCKVATNHGRRRHHCCEYEGVRWICMGGGAVVMPRIYDWLSSKVGPLWRGANERFWSMANETLCPEKSFLFYHFLKLIKWSYYFTKFLIRRLDQKEADLKVVAKACRLSFSVLAAVINQPFFFRDIAVVVQQLVNDMYFHTITYKLCLDGTKTCPSYAKLVQTHMALTCGIQFF